MTAGHTLAAHRFPALFGPAPAVVLFTPYRKEGAWLTYPDFATYEGYEVFVVDVRATGGSGGPFEGPLSTGEVDDAVDLLAWVAAQDYCDGQTALIGSSYSGLLQYLVAARRPPSLRCIAPSIAPVDLYRDFMHRGGIPTSPAWYASTYGGAGHVETKRLGLHQGIRDIIDPWDGPSWQNRAATPAVLRRINVPVLCLGGLYDLFSAATPTAFAEIQTPKRMVLGDWGHETEMTDIELEELSKWLAYWLKNEGIDPTRAPNIRLHRTGDGTWETADTWPGSGDERWVPVALLDSPTEVPVVTGLDVVPAPTSTVRTDPSIDAVIDSGMRLWGESWTTRTTPWAMPVDLRGPSTLVVDVRVDACRDVDLHARLSLVRTDHSIEQVAEGRLRASHREFDPQRSTLDASGYVVAPWRRHRESHLIDPGAVTRLEVGLAPINVHVAAGERLQIGLTLARSDGVVVPSVATLLPSCLIRLPLQAPTEDVRQMVCAPNPSGRHDAEHEGRNHQQTAAPAGPPQQSQIRRS